MKLTILVKSGIITTGRLDVLIEPVAGSGQRWVQCDRLQDREK